VKKLFDLGFLELHVLADHRVVLVKLQLGGLGAGILFGHVEISRVRGGNQFDLNDVRFGHDNSPIAAANAPAGAAGQALSFMEEEQKTVDGGAEEETDKGAVDADVLEVFADAQF